MSTCYRVFSLFDKLRVVTDGATGVNGVYAYVDLNVPGLSQAVLVALALELITLQHGAAGTGGENLEWNVELISGYDRDNELPAVPVVGTDIHTNDTPARSGPYTTMTSFLPHARLRLRFKNKSGINGVQSAILSATLLVKIAT